MSNSPLSFAFDTNEVSTAYPVLPEGSYIAKIAAAEVVESSTTPGNFNLRVRFETTAPATSLDGLEKGLVDDVAPGHKLTRYFPLQPSARNPDFDFRKGLVELQDAALKTKQGERPPFNPEDLVNRELVIVVKVREDKEGPYAGQKSNDVARVRTLNA